MADPRWARLQAIFEQAVALDEPERSAFVAEACGNDTELRQEVEALLRADDSNAGDPKTGTLFGQEQPAERMPAGTVIGPWRIIKHLGTGGMGIVYLAERVDGSFEQQVAMKVVKLGMDSENVIERFRQERQILARLDHPNIARLLDGGVTERGQPYFVMELIDGLPITEYCDKHGLGVGDRLQLFAAACDAVHAAHRNLVVHRDLKPSNIIVTHDGDLKLLDFGIAKLLDAPDDQHLTKTGLQLHTPAYAAPEQLLDEAISTATDIYALGVILYELLSGRRPFEARRTPAEFRELVLTGVPARPSAALTRIPADTDGHGRTTTVEEISAMRGLRAETLRRRLRGDLDTICLMALRREPEMRYSSAAGMATDIDRHLRGLPVEARPDSMLYRAGKFYRRHRAGIFTTAGVMVAFIVMISYYTIQLTEERDLARAEQRKANEVVDFVTGLFEVSNPSESRGEEITVRELLDEGAVRIRYELAGQPDVQTSMQRVLGEVYYSLGAHERSAALLEETLERQRANLGENNLEITHTMLVLGFVYQDRGENDAADALYREALEIRQRLLGAENPEVMEALSARAFLEETIGNFDRAIELHEQVLEMARRLHSGDHEEIASAMNKLAGIYRIVERIDEAEPMLRDALAMQDRIYQGPHPKSSDTKRQLAGLLRNSRRFEEAESLYLEVIAEREKMLGPDHVELAHAWNSYSQLLSDVDDIDGAVAAEHDVHRDHGTRLRRPAPEPRCGLQQSRHPVA